MRFKRRKHAVIVSAIKQTGPKYDPQIAYELSPTSYSDNPLPLKEGTELVVIEK